MTPLPAPVQNPLDTVPSDGDPDIDPDNDLDVSTVSHTKLAAHSCSAPAEADDLENHTNTDKYNFHPTGYRFVNIEILQTVIQSLICPLCNIHNVELSQDTIKRGLAFTFVIRCVCGYESNFCTSNKANRAYDVNKRFVYSMRTCGQGYASMEKFCTFMDMPKPMNKNNYTKLSRNIATACKETAGETMKEAADELDKNANIPPESVIDVSVSNVSLLTLNRMIAS